jgi:hypothetical protein
VKERERAKKREIKMRYLSHYSDWARGWTVEKQAFDQVMEG